MDTNLIQHLSTGSEKATQVINEFLLIIERCGYSQIDDNRIYGVNDSPVEGQLVYEVIRSEDGTLLQEYSLGKSGYYKAFMVNEPFDTFLEHANLSLFIPIEIDFSNKTIMKITAYITKKDREWARIEKQKTDMIEIFLDNIMESEEDDSYYNDTAIYGKVAGHSYYDYDSDYFSITKHNDTQTLLAVDGGSIILVDKPFSEFFELAMQYNFQTEAEYDYRQYKLHVAQVQLYEQTLAARKLVVENYLEKYPQWRKK